MIFVYRIAITTILIFSSYMVAQTYNNKAADFNGQSSYISVADSPELDPSEEITIEAWIFPRSYNNFPTICGKKWVESYWLGINDSGRIRFNPKGGQDQYVDGNSIIPLNQWTHVSGTYNGSVIIIYINGVPDISISSSGLISHNGDSLYIGCDRQNDLKDYFFDGMIDNLRIWSYGKTNDEILRDMYVALELKSFIVNKSSIYRGLLVSYTFENEAAENSGFENNSGIIHNVNFINQFNSNYNDYNNNLFLDGSSYLTLENHADLNPVSSVTIEAWIKWDSTEFAHPYNILSKGNSSSTDFSLYLANNNLFFGINDGSIFCLASDAVPHGQWTHIAGVYNSQNGNIQLYVNGSIASEATYSPQFILNSFDSIYIGKSGLNGQEMNNFQGQIDNIRIWPNVVRTPEEIRQWMFKGNSIELHETGFCSITFDDFENMYFTTTGTAQPIYFHGNALINSSHLNGNLRTTSPVLISFYNVLSFPENYKMSFGAKPIPGDTIIIDSIYIGENQPVTDVELFTAINYNQVNNLRLSLISPVGIIVDILPSNGSDIGDDIITIFDMNADNEIGNGENQVEAPYSPSVKPVQSFNVLLNQNTFGWWKLRIINLSGSPGNLNGWGLHLQGILPVELTDFSAAANQNSVTINWTTATETNNNGFFIERKIHGSETIFKKIGFIKGKGNSTQISKYSFIDANLEKGTYAYRLNQVDLDGSYSFSDIVEIDIDIISQFALKQNYPNPFNPITYFEFRIPDSPTGSKDNSGLEYVELKIYDILGNEVATLVNENRPAGEYKIKFDGGLLASGIYFYKLRSGKYTDTKKFVLLK